MTTIVDFEATRTARATRFQAEARFRFALDAARDALDASGVTRGEMVEAVEAITAALAEWESTVEAVEP